MTLDTRHSTKHCHCVESRYKKSVLAQMIDDAAAEKAGSTKHGDDAPSHDASMRSILLAMMKSFSCSPLIFLVRSDTVA